MSAMIADVRKLSEGRLLEEILYFGPGDIGERDRCNEP